MTGTPNTRSAITALHGMVTCPHALASQAGAEVLKAGGSAVDTMKFEHQLLEFHGIGSTMAA